LDRLSIYAEIAFVCRVNNDVKFEDEPVFLDCWSSPMVA